jgi:hypothetical protein
MSYTEFENNIHLVSLKNTRNFNEQLNGWPETINSPEDFFGLCLSLASKIEDAGLDGLNVALGSLGEISMENYLDLVLFLRETNWDDFSKVSQITLKTSITDLDKSINSFFKHFDLVLNSSVQSPKIYSLAQTALVNLLLDLFEIKLK